MIKKIILFSSPIAFLISLYQSSRRFSNPGGENNNEAFAFGEYEAEALRLL
jgi:hypothetical protein